MFSTLSWKLLFFHWNHSFLYLLCLWIWNHYLYSNMVSLHAVIMFWSSEFVFFMSHLCFYDIWFILRSLICIKKFVFGLRNNGFSSQHLMFKQRRDSSHSFQIHHSTSYKLTHECKTANQVVWGPLKKDNRRNKGHHHHHFSTPFYINFSVSILCSACLIRGSFSLSLRPKPN